MADLCVLIVEYNKPSLYNLVKNSHIFAIDVETGLQLLSQHQRSQTRQAGFSVPFLHDARTSDAASPEIPSCER